jgi:uncharacterized protein
MSELIDNPSRRKDVLKRLIRSLHGGANVESVRAELGSLLGQVPYDDVVAVEQELVREGLPIAELTGMCDLHSAALRGAIDQSRAKTAPPGHPVHTFLQENRALAAVLDGLERELALLARAELSLEVGALLLRLRAGSNQLGDVDKHYRRKEYLLFPFLEKREISGPPKVMWAKHDEARAKLKGAREVLEAAAGSSVDELRGAAELVLRPAVAAVREMIDKEEKILFPMCLDQLTAGEWLEIERQSTEIGYCLYDPLERWQPEGHVAPEPVAQVERARLQLPSGSFALPELVAMLNTLPVDLTFVDQDDVVRYFTQGRERVFDRNRAILGRKVQLCHPPASVHVVERILDDFRAGRQDSAAFWLELRGRFIHIEYRAVRDPGGSYLGTVEISQDLTEKRALQGDRRLLTYTDGEQAHAPHPTAPAR